MGFLWSVWSGRQKVRRAKDRKRTRAEPTHTTCLSSLACADFFSENHLDHEIEPAKDSKTPATEEYKPMIHRTSQADIEIIQVCSAVAVLCDLLDLRLLIPHTFLLFRSEIR